MHRSRQHSQNHSPHEPPSQAGQQDLFRELNAPPCRPLERGSNSLDQRYQELRPRFADLPDVSARVSELGRIYRYLDHPREYKMTADDCILCIECYAQVSREARRAAHMSREPRLAEKRILNAEELGNYREITQKLNFVDCLTSLAFTHPTSKVRVAAIEALQYTFPATSPCIIALAHLAHYKADHSDTRRAERIAAMNALEEMPISAMYREAMLKEVIPRVIRQVDDEDPSIQSCAFRISALLTEQHLGLDEKGEQINLLRRNILGRAADKLKQVVATMGQTTWTLPDIGHGALHAILILAPTLSSLVGKKNEKEAAKAVLERLYRGDNHKHSEQ